MQEEVENKTSRFCCFWCLTSLRWAMYLEIAALNIRPVNLVPFTIEAPIDLMSYCTLHRSVKSNAVALCCLYDGPLDTYLQENRF